MSPSQQAHYDQCIAEGCSPRLAEMLALASPPQIRTDATFQAKANGALGGGQFSAQTREHMLAQAAAAGVSTDGKVYEPRIARFPGDPQAWVSGPSETKKVIEGRGWSCDGDIKVAGPEREPVKEVPIAQDLIEERVEQKLEQQLGEDFTHAEGAVVKHAIEDAHTEMTPHWAK